MAESRKKGLGTGLGALLGESESFEGGGEVTTLSIAKVEPREDQPRTSFDSEALEALADSIEQYGVIQPITVRRLQSGYYQIIAGERRWRASRLAGLSEIPVRVIEADDRRAAELALVENLQREDLNPIEEAAGFRTLIDEYGLTQEEAARSVGKSRPTITNALRLLDLSAPVIELVRDGRLSAGHARALLIVQNPAEQLRLATEVAENNYSVRRTEQLANRINMKPGLAERIGADAVSPDYAAEAGLMLTKALGRKCRIVDGKRVGKIVLEYYGSDDREALLAALEKLSKHDL